MKKKIVFILFLSVYNLNFSQELSLTKEQKVKDLLYLIDVLKENYPFFEYHKRVDTLDWIAKKNVYIQQVENTTNDSTFIISLQNIIKELNDGHLNLSLTKYAYDGYYIGYKNIAQKYPKYKMWLDIYDKAGDRCKYWSNILKNHDKTIDLSSDKKTISVQKKQNYRDSIIKNGQIAVMRIASFNQHSLSNDSIKINQLLQKIKDFKFLIIDIQENTGGASWYWTEHLVSKLIDRPITYVQYPIIKEGTENRKFYQSFFENATPLTQCDKFPLLPKEIIENKYYIQESIDTIHPKNSINFKGKVFLLVSKKVFSSAEGFAQFCKSTNWATIAGERTGGDGVGSDAIPVLLPESKIIVSYPALIGINHNGSLNAEERTMPDIFIDLEDSDDRLEILIQYLRRKSSCTKSLIQI